MNPNGYAGPTLNQFQDAGPLEDGCDILTCTARVGGEHSEKCGVSDYRCWLCKRILGEHDADWTLVDFGLHVERICDPCREKGDEGIEVPLDYTEDEPDGWREGQPEFNGSFG